MEFEKSGRDIRITLDTIDEPIGFAEVLAAMSWSADIDLIDVLNEDAPVCWGNSYAVYEFTAIAEGAQLTYPLTPNDLLELASSGTVTLSPYPQE